MKYKCTYCKKIFDTKEKGFKHYKEKKHPWGALEHLEE